jgi:hypothetical protein
MNAAGTEAEGECARWWKCPHNAHNFPLMSLSLSGCGTSIAGQTLLDTLFNAKVKSQ